MRNQSALGRTAPFDNNAANAEPDALKLDALPGVDALKIHAEVTSGPLGALMIVNDHKTSTTVPLRHPAGADLVPLQIKTPRCVGCASLVIPPFEFRRLSADTPLWGR
jgi:hypothetical protein